MLVVALLAACGQSETSRTLPIPAGTIPPAETGSRVILPIANTILPTPAEWSAEPAIKATAQFVYPSTPVLKDLSPLPSNSPEIPESSVVKQDLRGAAIAALFAARGAPLAAYAGEMVAAAVRWGIDWRMLPTIAILESGGGLHPCRDDPENAYGYASCEGVDFASPADAIETVAATLAGGPYAGLDALTRLCVWVAGDSTCGSEHARTYRDRGAGLFALLDGGR